MREEPALPHSNHSNRVEDNGLDGRESIIGTSTCEYVLARSEPPGSRPDSVWSITPRGDDYGETVDDEEERVDSEEESADGDEINSDDEVAGHWPLEHL